MKLSRSIPLAALILGAVLSLVVSQLQADPALALFPTQYPTDVVIPEECCDTKGGACRPSVELPLPDATAAR